MKVTRRRKKPVIIQRTAEPSDFEDLIDLSRHCFPNAEPWKIAMLKSQYKIFPEGMQLVIYEGTIVGSATSLIVNYDDYGDDHTWAEMSEMGYITNHDPEGDTLYGIEVMVHPEFQGLKIGRRLYEMRQQLCMKHNLKQIMIGGRLPNFYNYSDKFGVRAYIQRVIDKKIKDPVLTFQLAQGFTIQKIIKGYLPDDRESEGYATLLKWVNLDYIPETKERTVMQKNVRVLCVQFELRKVNSFNDFAQQCEYFTDVASNYKADFAVFPELITSQLLSLFEYKDMSPEDSVRKLDEFTDEYISLFSRLALEYNINIVGGTHVAKEGDNIYNVCYLFKRDGTYEMQYKLHITTNEKKWWGLKQGNEQIVMNTDCGKVAINVGYDIEFPELARIATQKGAKIIFVPFSTDEKHDHLRLKICAMSRAIENQVYVVTSGTIGTMPSVPNMDINYAQSGIYTPVDFAFPPDAIAGECAPNVETVVIADLDLALLERHRNTGTSTNWKDRRLDLYNVAEL